MTIEKNKTPDEILEEARKLIGRETEPVLFPYPVEHETIRRYCMMVDDENPLFLDPDYAKQTKYGAVLYPPFAPVGVMSQGSPGLAARTFGGESKKTSLLPPTPGSYFMNMSMEWEWFKPIIVGDRLTTKTRLGDVYIKPIRIDPKAFWIVLELHFANQIGEAVCLVKNILLNHRSPDEITANE